MNILKKIVFPALICHFAGSVQSQKVVFEIKDAEKNPLISALIVLKSSDSKKELVEFSDAKGMVLFGDVTSGTYFAEISYLGFENLYDTLHVQKTEVRKTYTLQATGKILEEVKIVGKRPLMRQDGDKIILDPEPLLGSSTNTLEVLEATPGLIVDPDGGIFLNNSNPAAVYINGREQRLGTQDIMNILRSLPPGNILRIEILRNPSTKYDASSTGGIINIVLKKGVKLGQYGSFSAGMNQGKSGNRFGGLTYNNTGVKSGITLQLNYNLDAATEDVTATRSTIDIPGLQQINENRRKNQNIFAAVGVDHTLKKDNQLSYFGTFNANINTLSSEQTNIIQIPDEVYFLSNNRIMNDIPFYSHRHDLGWNKKLDTIGSDIDIKLSAGQSFSEGNQHFIYGVVFPVSGTSEGFGALSNHRNFMTGQVDFTKKWGKGLLLESGLKTDIQGFQSSTEFRTPSGSGTIPDSTRTNAYRYRDYIHGAYLQMSKELPWKITLKSGVRVENTNMSGQQEIPVDTTFDVKRTDFFPYVYLSRTLFTMAGFEMKGYAIYRKTLSRPSYQNLNPAIQVLDPFNYSSGNPSLAPQFTDNFEFNVSFDDTPIFAIGRNYTTGIISNVLYEDANRPGQTFNTFDNIGKSKETYFRIVGAIPPGGKYFFVAGAQYNRSEYEGLYNGQPITFDRGSWRFFTFHNLKIGKNTRCNVFGFVLVKGQQNLMALQNFGQVNVTVHQSFLDKKLQISVFGRDIFRTMKTGFVLDQGGVLFEGSRYADNQRWGMTLRYNFGINSKKEEKGMFDVNGSE